MCYQCGTVCLTQSKTTTTTKKKVRKFVNKNIVFRSSQRGIMSRQRKEMMQIDIFIEFYHQQNNLINFSVKLLLIRHASLPIPQLTT